MWESDFFLSNSDSGSPVESLLDLTPKLGIVTRAC